MPEFPFKKMLRRFYPEDVEGDEPDRAEKAAWKYAEESAAGLRKSGLVEFFGIVVRKATVAKKTWEVWVESWDDIKNGKKNGKNKK